MISIIIMAMIFAAAFLVTTFAGAGWAYVFVYLPSMILLNQLPELAIAHAPVRAHFAPVYGIILGMPFNGQSLRFKWNSVDTIIVLLLISSTITACSTTTDVVEAGINNVRNEIMTWVGPYFLARIVFRELEIRRWALTVLIGLLAIISVAALIEFRIQPYFYLHVMQNLGLGNKVPSMAYIRYNFFRVSGPVEHPIYFGNMCLVLMGMVAVLAKTTGAKLSNPWVALALFGAFGCIITSISFTPYVGVGAGIVLLLTLKLVPFSRRLVLPMTMTVFGALFAFTYTVAHERLGDKPGNDLEGSLWTRKLIITQSWKKAVLAGPFGYGRALDFGADQGDFDLSSVDNSYMLFTMSRGWCYTGLWICIAMFFAFRMTLAFNRATSPSQVFPLAVATATVLGLMVSMYTVWAGALYVVVWSVMLGLCNTVMDMVIYPELLAKPAGRPARSIVQRNRRGNSDQGESDPSTTPFPPAMRTPQFHPRLHTSSGE